MKRALVIALVAVGLLAFTAGPAVAADDVSTEKCTQSTLDDSFSTQACTYSLGAGTLGCTDDGDDGGGTC